MPSFALKVYVVVTSGVTVRKLLPGQTTVPGLYVPFVRVQETKAALPCVELASNEPWFPAVIELVRAWSPHDGGTYAFAFRGAINAAQQKVVAASITRITSRPDRNTHRLTLS